MSRYIRPTDSMLLGRTTNSNKNNSVRRCPWLSQGCCTRGDGGSTTLPPLNWGAGKGGGGGRWGGAVDMTSRTKGKCAFCGTDGTRMTVVETPSPFVHVFDCHRNVAPGGRVLTGRGATITPPPPPAPKSEGEAGRGGGYDKKDKGEVCILWDKRGEDKSGWKHFAPVLDSPLN